MNPTQMAWPSLLTRSRKPSGQAGCIVFVTGLFLSPLSAQAQTQRTWDNGHSSNDWSQKNNWSSNNLPSSSSEVARFAGNNAGTTSIDINTDQSTGGMLFDAGLTVNITFNEVANELSIQTGGANYGIINNSIRTHTFQNKMAIEADMTWASTGATGGGLIYNHIVNTGGRTLTLHPANADNFINIAGSITNSGNLVKTGSGSVSLSGNNTFSGSVTVSGGTLTNSGTNVYAGGTTINNGATLIAASNSALGSSSGTTTVNTGGTLALTNGITLNQATVNLAGPGHASSGALQNISGSNALIANFKLTGATTINSATGNLVLGSSPGYNSYANQTLTTNGHSLTVGGAGNTTLYAGLSGSGNLTKIGSGILTIEGTVNRGTTPTFTGQTYINDGQLILATLYNDAPGVGPLDDFGIYNHITVGDGAGSAQSARLTIGTNDDFGANDYSNLLAGGVNVTVKSDGRFDTQGHTQFVQNLTLDGGIVVAQTATGAVNSLFVTGNISSTHTSQVATIDGLLDFNGASAKSINVTTGSTLDINARVQNGGINKSGTGTLILSGANTYTGTTDITQGIVRVDHRLGLGAVAGSTVVRSGAQLQLDNVAIGAEALTLNATGVSNSGALRTTTGSTNSWAGNITLASNAEIETATGSTLTVSGAISGSSRTLTVESIGNTTFTGTNTLNTLNKTGAGNLTLSGNTKTYANANVTAGNLTLATSNILADAMNLNVSGTGKFTMASGINETIAQLTVSGSGNLDVDGILTLNGGTISGGDGSASSGTLKLTAGSVTTPHTLLVSNDFNFGGTLELSSNTVLALAGDGTKLSLGTLRITGDTVIDFGAGVATELSLGALQIIGSGTSITVNNWVSFQDLWTTGSFNGGFSSVLIDERDNNTAQITFSGYSPSDTIWLTFDYGANEITVPEPSTYGVMLIGSSLSAWLLRRPRRKTGADYNVAT